MIELQPGDYVSTKGMTEEQYHAVCKAFMEAGAKDLGEYNNSYDESATFLIYHLEDKSLWISRLEYPYSFSISPYRELTIQQILDAKGVDSADNTGQEEPKMTKITVFGQEEAKKEEKKIQLVYFLDVCEGRVKTSLAAGIWDNVCLLGKADTGGEDYDLIMAWDNNFRIKCIYLGHWNDGVID